VGCLATNHSISVLIRITIRIQEFPREFLLLRKKKKNLFSAQKPNTKMNKHVNKVRKATSRAKAITAGRQQNKQQYLIIQLMKKKER